MSVGLNTIEWHGARILAVGYDVVWWGLHPEHRGEVEEQVPQGTMLGMRMEDRWHKWHR